MEGFQVRFAYQYGFYTKNGKWVLPPDCELMRIRRENAKVTEGIQKALSKDAWKWAEKLEKKYPKAKPDLFKNFTKI